jgi:hypothetical protein
VIPHLEVLDLAEDVDFSGHAGRIAKPGGDDDPALRVELADLTVVIDAVEELEARRVGGWHSLQPLLDRDPRRHRVHAHRLSGDAGHVEPAGAVLLLHEGLEGVRDLQPTLVVDSRGIASPEHFYSTLLQSVPREDRGTVVDCQSQSAEPTALTCLFRWGRGGETRRQGSMLGPRCCALVS